MRITHVYFDWSGTLALSGSAACRSKTTKPFFKETIRVLKFLRGAGYKIGIISNSRQSTSNMISFLEELGVRHFFDACIVFTDGLHGMCKKPCRRIFEHVLLVDSIEPQQAVMIGNNFFNDILGARNAHMHAVFIDRTVASSDDSIKNLWELPKRLRRIEEARLESDRD